MAKLTTRITKGVHKMKYLLLVFVCSLTLFGCKLSQSDIDSMEKAISANIQNSTLNTEEYSPFKIEVISTDLSQLKGKEELIGTVYFLFQHKRYESTIRVLLLEDGQYQWNMPAGWDNFLADTRAALLQRQLALEYLNAFQ